MTTDQQLRTDINSRATRMTNGGTHFKSLGHETKHTPGIEDDSLTKPRAMRGSNCATGTAQFLNSNVIIKWRID